LLIPLLNKHVNDNHTTGCPPLGSLLAIEHKMPPQTIVQQNSINANAAGNPGLLTESDIQTSYTLGTSVDSRSKLFNNAVANPGSHASSDFGVQLRSEKLLGPTIHVFALGTVKSQMTNALHMYSQEGFPVFVLHAPEDICIRYRTSELDLCVAPVVQWFKPTGIYSKYRSYRLYVVFSEPAQLSGDEGCLPSKILKISPSRINVNYTILDIPCHEFRDDDLIIITGVEGALSDSPIKVIEIEMDQVIVEFNLFESGYNTLEAIECENARATYQFYTEPELDCTEKFVPAVRFLGVSGCIQPYQFHTDMQVITIATLIHGSIKIVMSEEDIEDFVTGDQVFMNFKSVMDNKKDEMLTNDIRETNKMVYKITYAKFPHNSYLNNQPPILNARPQTIYIGTFITPVEDPIYKIAWVSYVGGNRVVL